MKHVRSYLAVALAGLSTAQDSRRGSAPVGGTVPGPFGIGSCHTNNRSAQDTARWVPQMEAIGLRSYRTRPTGWAQVEPAEGKWDWEALDGQMEYLAEHGLAVRRHAQWQRPLEQARQAGHAAGEQSPGVVDYVTAIVRAREGEGQALRGLERAAELHRQGSNAGRLRQDRRRRVRRRQGGRSDCLVGLAAKSAHVNYLEQVIKAGAKDHFDYIMLHPYEVLNGIADNAGTEAVFMNIVPTVRKMLAAQNPAKAERADHLHRTRLRREEGRRHTRRTRW